METRRDYKALEIIDSLCKVHGVENHHRVCLPHKDDIVIIELLEAMNKKIEDMSDRLDNLDISDIV